MGLLTRRQWWTRVALTITGTWSVMIGLLTGFGRMLTPPEWGTVLLCTGVGVLALRLSAPEPATAADLAVLTTSPAIAKALAKEHARQRLFWAGVILGAGVALTLLLA